MSILSLLVYGVLQIIFIPFAIVGGMMVAYTQLKVSKKLGVSQTAIEVLNGRWAMHVFGMRDDIATARLASVLPNTSVTGLWLCLIPLWVKFKLSGRPSIYPRIPEPGSESVVDLIVARTLYFDHIIERVKPQVEQFVILGAGYDTRAYGMFDQHELQFYEVDQSSVQDHKRKWLAMGGISSEHVKFVTVDFDSEDVFQKLLQSGYDSKLKTLFLWEGVTLYLSEANVRKMIKSIRSKAAPGSTLVVDIYSDWFVKKFSSGAAKQLLDYTDEGLQFGLDFSSQNEKCLLEFAQSEDMSLGETHLMGRAGKTGAFVAIAEMQLT